MNKLIYLTGPYSYNPELAFKMHMEHAVDLIKIGYLIFSPILHSHQLAYLFPTGFISWKDYNKEILYRCDELWIITEGFLFTESKEVQDEIMIANERGIPKRYIVHNSDLADALVGLTDKFGVTVSPM